MPPIPAERCLSPRELSEPRLTSVRGVDMAVFGVAANGEAWLEALPLDGSGTAGRLATMPALRPARSLGGGSWCLTDEGDAVVYLAVDGDLWRQSLLGGGGRAAVAQRLTTTGPDRSISGPVATPDGRYVAYTVDMAEVWCLDLMTGATHRVDDGTDAFVIDPFTSEGTVGWIGWSEPDMPWDHTRVREVSVPAPDGPEVRTVVERPQVSVQQARRASDGALLTIRDDDGWLNVWRGDQPLVAEPFEHGGPTWGPGQRSYAVSPDGAAVAFTRNERGFGRLCVVDRATLHVREVARGVHGQLDWHGHHLVALRTGGTTPTQVVCFDMSDLTRRTLAVGPDERWAGAWRDDLAEPELHEVPVGNTAVHARLYRAAPHGGGLIVWLHGGPTDQWQVTFMPRLAYWRSRGWNILVPDHRGSTGHGRDYQQALRGRWGEVDVADVVACTRWAQQVGVGRPDGTVLMGGSAGGYTALQALAHDPSLYAAAAVAYPVTDLVDLAERSHRFERHYTDSLVGPLPSTEALHRERSPIWHTDRFTTRPLLVLHGDADPVVPVEQSRVFVERVRAAGGDATLHVYPGEGHGFRRREHQLDEYARIEDFLHRTVPGASHR